ncbi:hypothetical protein E3N88_16055 [Mikania micrantha]|uniref:Uncharacterized protein n=1 Tax=Mikania micrantha TaxID=192012 RepID=A0A5N6P0E7_9ASTR|nr:hypothetical protein E3N88_16055 [Mikania micrantha]
MKLGDSVVQLCENALLEVFNDYKRIHSDLHPNKATSSSSNTMNEDTSGTKGFSIFGNVDDTFKALRERKMDEVKRQKAELDEKDTYGVKSEEEPEKTNVSDLCFTSSSIIQTVSGKAGKFSDHGPSTGPDSTGGICAGNWSVAGPRLRLRTHTNKLHSSPAGLLARRTSLPAGAHGLTRRIQNETGFVIVKIGDEHGYSRERESNGVDVAKVSSSTVVRSYPQISGN